MREQGNVIKLEKSLDFKWPKGISRSKKVTSQLPTLQQLLDDIEGMKKPFAHSPPIQLREDHDFRTECTRLFHKHGNLVWGSSANRTGWLVDAELTDLDGLYPKNLYYEVAEDQERYE